MLFWKEVLTELRQLDIDAPALGRKRKALRRIEDDYQEKIEDFAWQIYFEFWIYLLMQSKIGSSKMITNATLY